MKFYYLGLFVLIAACGDASLIGVNTDVGKSDLDALKQQVQEAEDQMKILQTQNEQLKQLLQVCAQNPLFQGAP